MIKHLFFVLLSVFSLNSKDQEPVTWSYEVEKLTNQEYKITFDAKILDGWKLYSQFSPEEGSVSTTFNYINKKLDYEADNVFNENPYTIGYDNVFKMDLFYFEKEASFNQTINLLNKDINQIKIEVDYSSCDDELCIFRNETFNIVLDKTKIIQDDDNVSLNDGLNHPLDKK